MNNREEFTQFARPTFDAEVARPVEPAPLSHPLAWLGSANARTRADDRERSISTLSGAGVRRHTSEGEVVLFSSNDYLGLSLDPAVRAAASDAALRYGAGAVSARVLSGSLPIHDELENALARLTGRESALLFGAGYLANLGVTASLLRRSDTAFVDRLCHASLVDGVQLSRSESLRYRHNDVGHLEELLVRAKGRRRPGARFAVITESLFGMDGDMAPLVDIAELCLQHDAFLIVDEAHAVGVYGAGGGIAKSLLPPDPWIVLTGTLSKALGSYGGWVCGSQELRRYLVSHARSFLFQTSLPPAAVGAALEGIRQVELHTEYGPRLETLAVRFRGELKQGTVPLGSTSTHILPVFVGNSMRSRRIQERLRSAHLAVPLIRPPTVPVGTERIRISLTLQHTESDILRLASCLNSAFGTDPELQQTPPSRGGF